MKIEQKVIVEINLNDLDDEEYETILVALHAIDLAEVVHNDLQANLPHELFCKLSGISVE